MELLVAVLLMIGAVALVFGVCALCLHLEKGLPEEYDERQQVARGKGYRLAFFVGLFYYIGASAYVIIADAPAIASASLIMAGLAVMLMALEFYCVLTHAAVTRWVSPVKAMVGYFLLGGVHLSIAIYRLLMHNGRYESLVWQYAYLFISVCFVGIGVAHLVQYLRRGKE